MTNPSETVVSVDEALDIATRQHLAGNLGEACAIYRKILAGRPDHPDALHLLGVALHQSGDTATGIELMEQAIGLDPVNAQLLNNCAEAYRTAGRLDDAAMRFRSALKVNPDYPEAHNNLGATLFALGRIEEAQEHFARAVELRPDYPEAHNNLGMALEKLGLGRDALEHFEAAVRLHPQYADALVNLEAAFRREGGAELALARLETELQQLLAGGEANPDAVAGHLSMGNLFRDQGKLAEAAAEFDAALKLDARSLEARNNLGITLFEMGRASEAVAHYAAAIAQEPHRADLHANLGAALQEIDRLDDATSSYREALRLDAGHANAHHNLALLLLAHGHFSEGWTHYAHRASVRGEPLFQDTLPADLSGKRVLITNEQGIGDGLFFLRYAPALAARGGRVAYRAEGKFAGLARRLPGVAEIVPPETSGEGYDYVVSAGDLPLVLGEDAALELPAPARIAVDADALERVRVRLAAIGPGPFIGVTWRAGKAPEQGRHHPFRPPFKSAPPAELGRALGGVAGTVLVLQRNPAADEMQAFSAALGRTAHDLSAMNDDLEEMLALLSLVDEYVGVSNTNTHLRAAAGRTARTLVPLSPLDWRWATLGEYAPWFPGSRVYREVRGTGWGAALGKLTTDLASRWGEHAETAYSRAHPSPRYRELAAQYCAMHAQGEKFLGIPPEQTFPGLSLPPQAARIKRLVDATGARTVLDYGCGKGQQYAAKNIQLPGVAGVWPDVKTYWGVDSVRCYDPCYPPFATLPEDRFDGVISTDVLEHCPEEDIPWIVDEIFSYATRFVFANVACYPAKKRLPTGENAHCTIRPREWWVDIVRAVAARYPGVRWEFWIQSVVETPSGKNLVEDKIEG